MASNPLTSECRRFSLENAHVGASREDLAFRPNHQGSERSLLCRSHGASQVFDELLAEQVQGRIRQREYPESAGGLEAHLFIHHCLHSERKGPVNMTRVPTGKDEPPGSSPTPLPRSPMSKEQSRLGS